MTRWMRFTALLAILALSIGLAAPGWAQTTPWPGPGALVTITGARGDAAQRCDAVTAAGGSAATVTMVNPGSGLSDYVDAVGTFALASAAAMTNVVATLPTLTGFNGTSASIGFPLASATTAALTLGAVSGGWMNMATPIKANANTAASVQGGTAITGAQGATILCYHAGP